MVQDASIIHCAYKSPAHLVKMQIWIQQVCEELEISDKRGHFCWSIDHILSRQIVHVIHSA